MIHLRSDDPACASPSPAPGKSIAIGGLCNREERLPALLLLVLLFKMSSDSRLLAIVSPPTILVRNNAVLFLALLDIAKRSMSGNQDLQQESLLQLR